MITRGVQPVFVWVSAVVAIALLLLPDIAWGEDGFHVEKVKGGYDTPVISGSEFKVHQIDRPQPPRVVPPAVNEVQLVPPPSDAMALFDGSSLDQFAPNEWKLKDGILVAGKGNLTTKDAFGDCQLHVEWRAPSPPRGGPMSLGNSGIFFMQRYELQIFDSYTCKIYADGSAGSV